MSDLSNIANLHQLPEGVVLICNLDEDYVHLGATVMEMWSEAAANNSDLAAAVRQFNEAARRNFTCGSAIAIERNGLVEYQPFDLYQKLHDFIIDGHRVQAVKQLRMAQFTLEDLMGEMMKRKLKLTLTFDGFTHEWNVAAHSTFETGGTTPMFDMDPSKSLDKVLRALNNEINPPVDETDETPEFDDDDLRGDGMETPPAVESKGVSAMVAAAMALSQQSK